MISEIYIPIMSLQVNYYDENDFYKIVLKELPEYIDHHLPRGAKFKSIEYYKDPYVTAFISKMMENEKSEIEELINKGLEITIGVFKILLDGEEDYTRRTLMGLEYLFKEFCSDFSFITICCFYLDEDGIKFFTRFLSFESDTDSIEGFNFDNLRGYTYLLEQYFYENEIPDELLKDAALMALTERDL